MNKKSDSILIAGAPAKYSDLRYATGLFSFDPLVFLRTRRKRFLIVASLDFGHVRRLAALRRRRTKPAGGPVKDIEVLSFSDFPVAKDSKTPVCDRIVSLLKKKNIRAVTVPFYFPIGLAKQLGGKGVAVAVADKNIFPEREIKTAKEIKYITHAQKAAGKAMEAAMAMISEAKISRGQSLKIGNKPLTSEAVRVKIENTARDFGCVCYGTIVAGGRQAVNPHETGWGALKANEPIVIDIFPQHAASGYWGDLTRTVVRGTPSDEIRKMHSAVRDAQRTAVAEIKAGVPVKKIHKAAVDLFKERGFFTGARRGRPAGFIHGIGHGVGIEIHENPSVGPAETKLREGNVITVEPGLYYHDRGGIRIEDIVLVTRTGCRMLASCAYPFIL